MATGLLVTASSPHNAGRQCLPSVACHAGVSQLHCREGTTPLHWTAKHRPLSIPEAPDAITRRPVAITQPFISFQKIDFGRTGKIGKNRPKIGTMAQKSVFGPFFQFWGYFSPIFLVRPKSIFRPFFVDFGPEARNRPSPRHANSQHLTPMNIPVISPKVSSRLPEKTPEMGKRNHSPTCSQEDLVFASQKK